MEDIIDKIIAEIEWLSGNTVEDGGFGEEFELKAVYFGDPGIIPQSLYPCAVVVPDVTDPTSQSTGWDQRTIDIDIGLLLDAREYFDASVDEANGDRMLVRASEVLAAHFQRRSKVTLDNMNGVVRLAVGATTYRVQERGGVIAKASRTVLTVQRNSLRVLD
jgi:hypothetical protein